MSEATTAETVQTDETVNTDQPEIAEATAEAPESKYDESQLDEFGQAAVARIRSNIERFNVVTTDLKSLSNDPAEIQKALYEGLVGGTIPDGVTVDPKLWEQYLKAREFVDKATAHFDSLADSVAKERATSNTDTEKVTALETERDALSKKINAARKMLSTEFPGAESLLPNMVTARGTSTGSGRGAGGKKMRGFTVSVDNTVATLPNADGQATSSFAAGAKVLGIPTADLQRAYFAAIDATPDNYQEKVAELTAPTQMSVNDKDGNAHDVVIERNAE